MTIDKKIRSTPWPGPYQGISQVHYLVNITAPVINHERQLVVTFTVNQNNERYQQNKGDFRIVLSRRNGKRFAVITEQNPNSKITLDKAMGNYTAPQLCYPEISERDEQMLARFLGTPETKNHQMENLSVWIEDALEEMKLRKMKENGEILDEDVTLCPEELPDGIEAWIQRNIIDGDQTLIYKKGNVRGMCYACRYKVQAGQGQRFRQGEITTCPNCGHHVVCRLEGGASYDCDYVQNIVAAQKGTDGKTVFFRQWHVLRDPEARYENITDWLEEFGRYAVRDYSAAKWLHEYKENYYMNTYRYKLDSWTRFSGVEVYDGSYEFFDGSIQAGVEGTRLQYADLPGYIRYKNTEYRHAGYGYHNIVRYAMDWSRYPVMEFLWKAGYKKLACQRVGGLTKENRNAIRWGRKSLKECFRFPLRLLKIKEPKDWSMDDVQKLTELWNMDERLNERDITELMSLDIEYRVIKTASNHAALRKIIKYLGTQQQANYGRVEHTYRDYLDECITLHLDLTQKDILFPRDLQEAHNRTMAQISFEKSKADQEAFQKQVRKLEKWAWEDGGLIIRPAKKQQELSKEGSTLHHCVGGYIKRMAEGETAIFFLRRKSEPDKPYYTLELKEKRVIQCRTLNNASYVNDQEVKEFVDTWLREVVTATGKKTKRKEVA